MRIRLDKLDGVPGFEIVPILEDLSDNWRAVFAAVRACRKSPAKERLCEELDDLCKRLKQRGAIDFDFESARAVDIPESVICTIDYDFPSLAGSFGWSIRKVQKYQRADFDYNAECGVYACAECNQIWYPMELDNEDGRADACPECLTACVKFELCAHSGSDGSVDCEECGVTASQFITAASEWLHDNVGAEAEDPGYFGG